MNNQSMSLFSILVLALTLQTNARVNDPLVEIVNNTDKTISLLHIKTRSPLLEGGRTGLKLADLQPGVSIKASLVSKIGSKDNMEEFSREGNIITGITVDLDAELVKMSKEEKKRHCPKHGHRLRGDSECKYFHTRTNITLDDPYWPRKIEITKEDGHVVIIVDGRTGFEERTWAIPVPAPYGLEYEI